MDRDRETDSGSTEPSEANSASLDNAKPTKKKGINLLKRSKHDLLRLLSILEGELEARDIFISTLQAQLNHQQNARQNYFIHRMNDPFLALHRDDYLTGKSADERGSQDELKCTEPLPLLEKVVSQFRNQQQKMHQQMALASKIHRKMAHELAEEKRKHAVDTKTGDDVTMALEKERERLTAGVMCEKERTKRIETEYKKLLVLCKEEGRKHKMIVVALLAEQEKLLQQLKQSRELQINVDSTETELQARLHEALKDKQDLALKLKEEQCKCSKLESRAENLKKEVAQLNSKKTTQTSKHPKNALERAVALYACDDHDEEDVEVRDVVMPDLPVKKSRASSSSSSISSSEDSLNMQKTSDPVSAFMAKHHPMSVAQSTQDVTLIPTSSHPPILLADGAGITTTGYYCVKPGSSIAGLEAMKSAAMNKEMLSLDFSKEDDVFLSTKNGNNTEPSSPNVGPKPPSHNMPPKPNRFIPGSPHYTPFRSPHSLFSDRAQLPITSSPTSGAANFAMNSPNSPNPPPSSPFAITRSPSVKANPKYMGNKSETPTKMSSFVSKSASPGRTPARPGQNSQFQSTRMKFQTAQQSVSNVNSTLTSSSDITKNKEDFVTERKMKAKKFTPVTYRSHITQKVSTSATLPNVAKLGNSSKTESSSSSESDKVKQPLPPKTRPSTASVTASTQVRPPPLPPKKPSLSSEKSIKCSSPSTTGTGKTQESTIQRKPGSTKRTMPLTPSNDNSIGNGKNITVKGPSPPTLPAKLSSQQPTPPAGPKQPPQPR